MDKKQILKEFRRLAGLPLEEQYYESRKDLEGYIDTDELIGKRLWFHTNRTHRNQGKNGMVGIYTVDGKGNRGKLTNNYTNEVRIGSPVHFQTSDSGAKRISDTGHRTLIAGVSGTVKKTDSGNTSGMEEATFNPFDENAAWFYLKNDSEKKEIISADEVYFYATEDGQWVFLVKGAQFSDRNAKENLDEFEIYDDSDIDDSEWSREDDSPSWKKPQSDIDIAAIKRQGGLNKDDYMGKSDFFPSQYKDNWKDDSTHF